MSSIFTKIVQGDIPSYKVAETDNCYAFLDINPLAEGHVLVIPKEEVDYLFDVEDDLYTDLMLFSKKVAKAIKKVIPCERIGVAVIGLEVPHAHVHLVPINNVHDIDFSRPKLAFSEAELEATAEKINAAFLLL
jgi:histidine triad (HIT) family protein